MGGLGGGGLGGGPRNYGGGPGIYGGSPGISGSQSQAQVKSSSAEKSVNRKVIKLRDVPLSMSINAFKAAHCRRSVECSYSIMYEL